MRIPRKEDLLRLQRQYKTDRRIAEALGGIPEYLVGYWRRKKGIPRFSEPKFTRRQIEEVWQRFGDDFRAGRELNLSRAAFYNWRRKYGITERPTVLTLEQLELSLEATDGGAPETAAIPKSPRRARPTGPPAQPRNIVEKILRRLTESNNDTAGASPLTPDASCGPDDGGGLLIHTGPPDGPREEYELTDTADFPRVEPGDRTTIRIPICRGAPGWRLLESRAISPGRYVATGERSLAALGAAAILVLDGNTSAALPVVKVELTRRLGPNLEIDDAIVELLRRGVADDWNGRIVEFLGAPVEHLSMDRKAKLCRLAAATGATAALCPFDDISRRYFGQLLRARRIEAHPDRTARYAGEHFLELRGLGQRLWDLRTGSGVDATDRALQAGTALRTIVIGPDALPYELEATARVLDDTDGLAPDVTLLVLPASIELYRLAIKRNWAATIADAGGSIVDPQLVQALGLPRLLGGGESPVCVTSPIDAALIEAPLYYGSVGTLLSIAERGGA